MKNLNSALAPKVILKGISMLMLVCLATLGVAHLVSSSIGGGTSQMPTMATTNYKVVDDIGGRSMEPNLVNSENEIIEGIGGNKPPVGEFDKSSCAIKAIGGKSTTGEWNTISSFEMEEDCSFGEIAFYLNGSSNIGGKSSDSGILNLAPNDLPIGGVKVPPPGEFKFTS